MRTSSRSLPPLLILALPAALLLGVATIWSLESERVRLREDARTAAREALADAASLISRRVGDDLVRAADTGAAALRDAGPVPPDAVPVDAPLAVLFDGTGQQIRPRVAAFVRTQDRLQAEGGPVRRDLDLALSLLRSGETVNARRWFEEIAARDQEDPASAAHARFRLALLLLESEGVDAAREHLKTLGALPRGVLATGPAYFVRRALLDDALARRDGGVVDTGVTAILDDLLPLVRSGAPAAETWLEESAESLDAGFPAAAVRIRTALQGARATALRLARAPGLPETLEAPGPDGLSRFGTGPERAAAQQVQSDDGAFLGTVVVLPPLEPGESAARELLDGLRSRGFEVVLTTTDAATAQPAAAVAPLGPDLPGRVLLARTTERVGLFPWRTALVISLILLAFVLVGAGVALSARSLRREKDLVATRSAFLDTVSHQLKTPVANLRLFAETLASGRVVTAEDRDRMQDILRLEAERLGDFLQRLLADARLGAEHAEPAVPISLSGLLAELEERWRRAATLRGLGFELACAPDLPAVSGDPRALADALQTVVENALRYTRAETTVRVRAGARNGRVTVCIEDQGPGIDPRDGDRIFERFYRGRAERTGDGTGLGLAIARAGAERAGGTLRVERTNADGTTMTFELPAARAAPQPTEELADGDDPARRG